MTCPDCGGETVAFGVPEDLRAYAPGPAARLCRRCLRVHPPADDPDADPRAPAPAAADFDAVDPSFPDGEAGVALALALGRLDSLALERAAVVDLLQRVEAAGADPLLALDRLDAPAAHVDLDRRRTQLLDFLE